MSIATVCPSHLATWSSDPPSVAANREGEKIAQAMKKHTQTLADQKKQDKAGEEVIRYLSQGNQGQIL